MLVYRVMKEKRFNEMMNGDTQNLGNYFSREKNRNRHKYKEDVKYLHFFKRKGAYENYFRSIGYKPEGKYMLVTFNIPFRKLILHSAKGFYFPIGYDCDYIVEREYALPVDNFNLNWIVGSELVKDFSPKQDNEEEKDCL